MNNFKKFLELFESISEELKEKTFTHSSFANEHHTESNERLEFLGDSVLSLSVSDYLYNNYHENEGKLSKVRSSFVCTENLSRVAKQMDIEKRIKLGNSFKAGHISDAMLENTVECMIGAIYLTYGFKTTAKAVLELLEIKQTIKKGVKPTDFKSILQEYTQKNKKQLKYVESTYITAGGQTNFKSGVLIDDQFYKYGTGSTKREAEQNAAKRTLKALEKLK